MRRSMGVASQLKAPTKGVLLLCPACTAHVVCDVLAVRNPVCRSGRLRRFLSVQMEVFVKGYFRTTIRSSGANLQGLVGCLYHRCRAAVGFPGLVVNGCCCGGVPLTRHRITYAASVSDFAEVVSKAPKRYRREGLLAAGVSLGGLLLSFHLCQRGPPAQLDAALAVSPPFEPAVAARTLSNPWGFNRLLNACITLGLVGSLRDSEEVVIVAKVIRADDVFRCWTLASFDPHYAAPAFGFQSVQDVLRTSSWRGRLCMVRRPVVFLVSADTR
ncbi:hypothetical protein V5799_030198 [Amblyomma americanum]|uniref:Uncharacterized protein n=1 Tax=Amblyomma americanum TaxID=6943 RepID=A0AAQ4ENV5_AMBAM